MSLEIPISSNAAAIVATLGTMPSRMAQKVAAAMDLENQLSIGHMQANYLTGPRPVKLGVRSNRLRSSPSASKAVVSGNQISSTIGTNVVYAGPHERGFHGTVTVRSFQRTATVRSSRAAAATVSLKTGRISRRPRPSNPGISTVRSHLRKMNVKARPFFAPTLKDRRQNYGDRISTGLLAAWQEGAS